MSIDREPWHTSRRENKMDYEQSKTPGRWARIADAIVEFQNKNQGMSPTDQQIMRETGLSLAQVQYHIREMVNAKMLTILRSWPRVIAVHDIVKPAKQIAPQEGGEKMQSTTNRRITNGMPFHIRAKQVAKVINDFWEQYQVPPTIAQIEAMVWGNDKAQTTGAASRVVARMADNGLVSHVEGRHDIRLTPKGKELLEFAPTPPPSPIVAPPSQRGVGTGKGMKKAFIIRAHEIAKAIVDIVDRTGAPASVREIHRMVYGDVIGTGGTSRMLKQMAAQGWIKHKPRHHRDIMLTGAGRAALFNEIPEDVPTDMPVHAVEKGWPVEQPRLRKPPGATIPRDIDHHAIPPRMRALQDEGDMMVPPDYRAPPLEAPAPAPAPAYAGSVEVASDLDLILELNKRGYKVSR